MSLQSETSSVRLTILSLLVSMPPSETHGESEKAYWCVYIRLHALCCSLHAGEFASAHEPIWLACVHSQNECAGVFAATTHALTWLAHLHVCPEKSCGRERAGLLIVSICGPCSEAI